MAHPLEIEKLEEKDLHSFIERNQKIQLDRKLTNSFIKQDIYLSLQANAKEVLNYMIGSHIRLFRLYKIGYVDKTLSHMARYTKLTKKQVRLAIRKLLDHQYIFKTINQSDKRKVIYHVRSDLLMATTLLKNSQEKETKRARSTPFISPTEQGIIPLPSYTPKSLKTKNSYNNSSYNNLEQKECQHDEKVFVGSVFSKPFPEKLRERILKIGYTEEEIHHLAHEFQGSFEDVRTCVNHVYYSVFNTNQVIRSSRGLFVYVLKHRNSVRDGKGVIDFYKSVTFFSQRTGCTNPARPWMARSWERSLSSQEDTEGEDQKRMKSKKLRDQMDEAKKETERMKTSDPDNYESIITQIAFDQSYDYKDYFDKQRFYGYFESNRSIEYSIHKELIKRYHDQLLDGPPSPVGEQSYDKGSRDNQPNTDEEALKIPDFSKVFQSMDIKDSPVLRE